MTSDGCFLDAFMTVGSAVCAVLLYDLGFNDAACLMSLVTIFVTVRSLGRGLP
jgi:hypothetical protein